jgi:hypothetical protein
MKKWDKREEELKNIETIQEFIRSAMETFTPILNELLGKTYLSDEERERLK